MRTMRRLLLAAAGSLLCAYSPALFAQSVCYRQISPTLYNVLNGLAGESEILTPTGMVYAVSSAAADPAGNAVADIVELNPRGRRDLTFGGAGSVVPPSPPAGTMDAALTRDSAGNLIIAIITADGANLVLNRFSPAGTLDTTYGTAGTVTIPFTQITGPWAIEAAPDGSVLIAAGAFPDASSHGWEPVVLKVTPAGALDTGFGTGGVSYFNTGAFGPAGKATDLSIRPDGTILVGGRVGDNHTYDYFFVARLLADGALDTSFGASGGMTTVSFGNVVADGRKMAVQQDGRIVLVGGVGPLGGPNTGVIRLTAGGFPDPSFNGTGSLLLSGFHGYQVALQPDDKILIAAADTATSQSATSEVVRLTYSGKLDTTFGNQHNGVVPLQAPGAASTGTSQIAYSPESGIHVLVYGQDTTGTVYTDYVASLGGAAGPGCH